MAKGNLLLGTASGKLGDVVFYRKQGQQLSRVRVRQVSNPQTLPQMISRVVLSTLTKSYSVLQPICDHSFQSQPSKAANMQRFMKLNSGILREPIDSGVNEAGELVWRAVLLTNGGWNVLVDNTGNFSSYDNAAMVVNRLQISEGTAPSIVPAMMGRDGFTLPLGNEDWLQNNTYQQICDLLGIPAGAQLTFVYGGFNDKMEIDDFHYSRLILRPADGNMNKPVYSNVQETSEAGVNDPNPANEFTYGGLVVGDDGIVNFSWPANSDDTFASIIVSWYDGTKWVRSTSYLNFQGKAAYDRLHLSTAINTYLTAVSSSKYLDQGEVE